MDVDPTRSRIMRAVGQKNTGPEMLLRSALHRCGLRYRLHDRRLPGSPDLIFPKYNAAVFVHGCYWHAHGCYRSTVPKTRVDFWTDKFASNRERDAKSVARLRDMGWRVLTVWECALQGKTALGMNEVTARMEAWLVSDSTEAEISGSLSSYPSGT